MPRGPLPWLIALEALVLLALGVLGWHVAADRLNPPPTAATPPAAEPKPARPHAPSPRPPAQPAPTPKVSTRPIVTPGLSTNPAFWQRNLTQLNRDQAAWEGVEQKAANAVLAFARAYIQQVVVPAVEAAIQRSKGPP